MHENKNYLKELRSKKHYDTVKRRLQNRGAHFQTIELADTYCVQFLSHPWWMDGHCLIKILKMGFIIGIEENNILRIGNQNTLI